LLLAKSTGDPHQMRAADTSCFQVVGWDYHYMVAVMNDYSLFILAWKLQLDMTSKLLI